MIHCRGRHYYMRKSSLLGSSANNKHSNHTYDKNHLNSAPPVAPVPTPTTKPPSLPKGPYGWTSRNPFDDTD